MLCWATSSVVSDSLQPHELHPTRLLGPWNSPGKNTGESCHFLLGIFQTWGLNLGPLHCRQSPASQADSLQLRHLIGDVLCLDPQSCPTLFNPMDCTPSGFSVHWDSPDKNPGMGCHALLQGSSQPREETQVSHSAGGLFTDWATRESTSFFWVWRSSFPALFVEKPVLFSLNDPSTHVENDLTT